MLKVQQVMPRLKTEEKRRAILEAASAVFAEKGFHATTVADIASEQGIGLGTFYRYFPNKLDVFHAVIDEVMAEVATVLAPESATASETVAEYRAQVERIGDGLIKAFQENRAMAKLLFVEAPGISEALNQKLEATYAFFALATQAYLDNGKARGFLPASLDSEVTAHLVNALVFETVRQVARDEMTDVKRWSVALNALMFDGIRGG